jgi:hypothetical protein
MSYMPVSALLLVMLASCASAEPDTRVEGATVLTDPTIDLGDWEIVEMNELNIEVAAGHDAVFMRGPKVGVDEPGSLDPDGSERIAFDDDYHVRMNSSFRYAIDISDPALKLARAEIWEEEGLVFSDFIFVTAPDSPPEIKMAITSYVDDSFKTSTLVLTITTH